MKKYIQSLSVIFIAILAYSLAALPAPALASSVTVWIDVPTPTVSPGDAFSVGVAINNVTNFDACNYDILYDPSVLRVDNVTDGSIQGTPIPVSRWNWEGQGKISVLSYVGKSRSDNLCPGVTGSGDLALIDFHAIGAGGTSSFISFDNFVLGDKDAHPITSTWTGATVYIGSQPGGGSTGGGGGGGGGDGGYTSIISSLDSHGRLFEDVVAKSPDLVVSVTLLKGTSCNNSVGGPLSSISIQRLGDGETRPVSPEYSVPMVGYYVLGPPKAKFDPPVTLSFKYDPLALPDGVSSSSLVIVRWNALTETWETLESHIDAYNNLVITDVDSFSLYTVMARNRPASFAVSDLKVTPASVPTGRSVAISVVVSNSGDLSSSYEVSPSLDGKPIGAKQVTVAGQDTQTVSFSATATSAGTHTVKVGDLSATFEVTGQQTTTAAPSAFTVSDLTITPGEVSAGQSVAISVLVSNNGDQSGDYKVTLFIDGTAFETMDVTVAGHNSQTVSFSAKASAGTNSVEIGDLSGEFTVIAPQTTTTTTVAPVLTYSDIQISPVQARVGEPVAISAIVNNNSDKTVSQEVALKINGITTSSRTVTIAAGSGQRVTFNITRDAAGSYIARIGDATANFEVSGAATTVRWSLIIIVICAVLVIGVALRFLVFAKKND